MGTLLGAYIFGSVARGQCDQRSDLDILAVVKTGSGKVEERHVLSLVPSQFEHLKPSISWYGESRLEEMFRNGELFAWHLHAETLPIFEAQPFIRSLGKPQPYTDALLDVMSFARVLGGIPEQIAKDDYNAIYECGLIYVCLRNIAMAASWVLCDRPDFSRYSPFNLRRLRLCPLSVSEYDVAMACRMAGQRGLVPPMDVDAEVVLRVYTKLMPWIDEVQMAIAEDVENG